MSGVDNTTKTHDWGDMESTVRGVRLMTFRDVAKLSKPRRKPAKRKAAKKTKRRADDAE